MLRLAIILAVEAKWVRWECGGVQCFLLHPGQHRYTGDVLLHQAPAISGGPGLLLQSHHQSPRQCT